ncbi:MAG: ABC transporter substrate-binding protein [Euryarchaeota archaeon]|nr:ABC transporter substrate-binding protein [Euryarchaeota archaeon]
MKIRVAHSPDADDAFMFYALARDRIDTGRYEFEHVLSDIETLNQAALRGKYEVSAVSIHAYPSVAENYALMTCGASMGYRYGPVVVSREPLEDLEGREVAVPGLLTSACLALKLYEPDIKPKVMAFDKIMDAVQRGEVEAGVIIHEGQLTYQDTNLEKVVDLGEWWYEETGLPLPLGGNVVRKDLGEKTMDEVTALVRESIVYALEHEDEALDHAMKYSGGLEREKARRFVRMYVNDFTVDYGEDGREGIRQFLERGREAGLIGERVEVEFVG